MYDKFEISIDISYGLGEPSLIQKNMRKHAKFALLPNIVNTFVFLQIYSRYAKIDYNYKKTCQNYKL